MSFRLEEVCINIVDCEHKTAPIQAVGIPSIRTTDIRNGRINFDKANRVSEETYKEWTQRLEPREDDLILTREAPVGEIGIIPKNKKLCLGQRTVLIRVNQEIIDPSYLLYLFIEPNMNHQILSKSDGSVVSHLNIKAIKNLALPKLPKINEQKAIAHILSTLDEKIEVNNQINKTLEKMAQAIFKQWFIDFEFPNEDGEPYQSSGGEMVESELGLVPKGWEVGSFTDYIDVLSGGTPKTKNKEYWDGKIPFFTPKDTNGTYCICTEKKLTEVGLNSCNSKLYDENTVFITARGTVGKIAMTGVKMAMNQSCYALVGKGEMNQFYVWFQIKSAVEKLQRSASGSVFDAIIIDTFKAIKIVKPETAHIEKFKNIVEPVFQSIQLKYFENEKLNNIRDNLLPKLMSGEIRVLVEGKNNEIS